MEVLKHFVEECVFSIQLGGLEIFWSIRRFLVKNYVQRISMIVKDFRIFMYDF